MTNVQTYDPELPMDAPHHSPATNVLQIIERAALNPNIDIDKMQRLLDMHQQMQDREARKQFDEAMAAAQAEMPVVLRNKYNEQTRSRYANFEAIAQAISPVVTRHGFSLSFGTDASPMAGHYRITCELSHRGGHSKHYHADIPADATGMKGNANKTATHAFGSTMSYGRRYLELLIFNVATGDDNDGNRQSPAPVETIAAEQVMVIRDKLAEVGLDEAKFCAFGKVERLEDITADAFEPAMTTIAKWAARQGAK
jgi:hypothetical protein